MKRILFVITEDWTIISHRLHLIEFAKRKGLKVGVATNFSFHRKQIQELGVDVFQWDLNRKSLNPIMQLRNILSLLKIIKTFKPDLLHAVAQKPVLYSGLLKLVGLKIPLIAAFGGIGFIFNSSRVKARLIRKILTFFLRPIFAHVDTEIILQNYDNIQTFQKLGVIKKRKAVLIPGSGVEIDKFNFSSIPYGTPVVILPARLLWDKGIQEFVDAASSIKGKGVKARFILVGNTDPHNSASVNDNDILSWVEEGIVEHLPRQTNMNQIYERSTIVCLPSYHEGTPKVLLEASSCGRPVITFDIPGCREIVKNGETGILVKKNNQKQLENGLIRLINDYDLCASMGVNGRKLMVSEFSDIIIDELTYKVWEKYL